MSFFRRLKRKKKETVREAIAEVGLSDTTGHKYGCHILLEDPVQDKVDIVFVHGLTGDRVSTWTALSGALGNIRESTDTMECPIIFIGHSLGGLVIEDCLLNSNTSHEDYIKEILRSTTAIAFLGTPHGGSNQAEMAIIGANFLKLFRNINKDILMSLTPASEALSRIQQDFHRVVNGLPDSRKIKITCFYEELPVKGIGEIVPKNSAILSAEELKRNRAATSAPGSQNCVASAHGVGQKAVEATSDRREDSNSRVDQVKKELYLSDPADDKEEIVAYKGKRSDALTRFVKIDLDFKTEKLQNDVFRFIDFEIEHLSEEKPYMDVEEVRNTLKAKADNTFLWVSLVMKELRKDVTSGAIKARLKTLPRDLNGIYQRLLNEIPEASHQHAKQILIWVTFAKQPLNIKGLATALSFASDLRQSVNEFEQTLKDFIRVYSSLVHEQNGVINLVHQSAKDFMLQEFDRDTPTWYQCPPGEAEKDLTNICFNYMEKTPFTVERRTILSDPELTHHQKMIHFSRMRSGFGQPMPNNPWKLLIKCLTSKVRSLMTIPRFGIPSLLRKLINSGRDINSSTCEMKYTPLHLAAYSEEPAIVRLLLDQPSNIWNWRRLNINAKDEGNETPLHVAIWSESYAVAKLLLEDKRINPMAKDNDGRTPLHLAVEYGEEETAALLLEKGVDPMAKDNDGKTPLHAACAAWCQHEKMVTLLLEKGVDPTAKDSGGGLCCMLQLYTKMRQ
ncbi:uncharacterized protein LAJ45_02759 [Morchella importuna]|uniref:uncharacterized protein n=1 Tax=Morchella importuna TaxID=1174673 RepID=UPI001E8D08CD|nr:uncharacterized protein LAJ45_02759 [Morchella importuna]KAH8153172.1 hypothetical protein LAJ45_02759 [Morchella importuna]